MFAGNVRRERSPGMLAAAHQRRTFPTLSRFKRDICRPPRLCKIAHPPPLHLIPLRMGTRIKSRLDPAFPSEPLAPFASTETSPSFIIFTLKLF
jgi:hypothetical protein